MTDDNLFPTPGELSSNKIRSPTPPIPTPNDSPTPQKTPKKKKPPNPKDPKFSNNSTKPIRKIPKTVQFCKKRVLTDSEFANKDRLLANALDNALNYEMLFFEFVELLVLFLAVKSDLAYETKTDAIEKRVENWLGVLSGIDYSKKRDLGQNYRDCDGDLGERVGRDGLGRRMSLADQRLEAEDREKWYWKNDEFLMGNCELVSRRETSEMKRFDSDVNKVLGSERSTLMKHLRDSKKSVGRLSAIRNSRNH
jgi:hypothetical protein